MSIRCIFCKNFADIVKAGFRYNKSGKKQKYKCNKCKSFFVPNDGFWKMKHNPEVISEAVIDELGTDVFLSHLSNLYWFQSLACVIGYD